jgi:ppGpp synthetase/RelA/SpoT-type nucleotidyltranferase
MGINNSIEQRWAIDKPIYEMIGSKASLFLKNAILRHEIYPELSYRLKELLSIVKKIERKSKEKEYDYDGLKDKLGIRIICSFSSQLEEVDKIVRNNFNVKKVEYKKEELDFDRLDYTSNHYDLTLDTNKIHFDNSNDCIGKVFELQVRSINQHAWSSSAHILTYKKEAKIPKVLQRRVYRLLSLYEIADDEFSNINRELQEKENDIAYQYIRRLEGKVYKYAKVDFDRQTSLMKLGFLLSPFKKEKQKALIEEVESFVSTNDGKLERVFDNYSSKFHDIPFLTQPEIFLTFYMLEKHESILEEVFANDLDDDELEKIKGIWV